tara:strand:- start:3957 stop:4094 length:138 start_codon:yes stop_codon:yes gene_type:complete
MSIPDFAAKVELMKLALEIKKSQTKAIITARDVIQVYELLIADIK